MVAEDLIHPWELFDIISVVYINVNFVQYWSIAVSFGKTLQ